MLVSQSMKHAAICLAFLTAASVNAVNIPIFNTGVDTSGAPLPGGSGDPHYDVVSTGADARVITNPHPSWIVNTSASQWIWQKEDASPGSTTLEFATTFDLTGLDALTAVIA